MNANQAPGAVDVDDARRCRSWARRSSDAAAATGSSDAAAAAV
jgi:hypothetical protein